MSGPRRLPLRILYTINSSPQYILARSFGPIPITLVDEHCPDTLPYATVSLKTCLETICRSSPELMQDNSHDFSVYVLDPLESNSAPAPMNISNPSNGRTTDQSSSSSAAQHPRGVAVGMGLMSWALSANESDAMPVVGTLAKTGTGQEALEVIFALRETASIDRSRSLNQSSWTSGQNNRYNQSTSNVPSSSQDSDVSTSTTTLATIASIQMRTKAKMKPKKAPRISSTPMTESDKLMSADTYIGPLKKKGRPKGPAATDTKVKMEDIAQPLSKEPSPAAFGSISFDTTTTVQSTMNTNSSHPSVSTISGSSNALDLLAILSSQNEAAQNATLLTALNLIDAPRDESHEPVNPALIDAIKGVLSAYAQAQITTPQHTVQALAQPPSTNDEDVVFLDKENVNPTAFRRRAEREIEDIKLQGNGDHVVPQPPAQNRGLSARSIENSPSKNQNQPLTLTPSSSTNVSSFRRKRTLSDFMDEKDNNRSKNQKQKAKEKERNDRKDPSSRSLFNPQPSSDNGLRHYPRLLAATLPRLEPRTNSYYRTAVEPWTSPPRPQKVENENENTAPKASSSSNMLGGSSRSRPIVILDSPKAPRVSASSPIRPTAGAKKPYVVPEWARTSTATQPRLSQEAQLALELAEIQKDEERRSNRRKSNAAAQERARVRGRLTSLSSGLAPSSDPVGPTQSYAHTEPCLAPASTKNDLPPIIASDSSLSFLELSSQRATSPPPTSRSLAPPVTPKRPSKIAITTPGTTDYVGESLFTPISIARRSGGAGSPLYSPSMFGSPLPRKRFRVSSPTSYRSKQMGSESSTITIKVADNEDAYNKPHQDEMDVSAKELDCPPSSLPIASSDLDLGDDTASNSADDEDVLPRKQHWIGLPPSSPPPPTSPGLMPVDDAELLGDDMEDLPVASETDEADDKPREEGVPLNTTESDWAPSPTEDFDLTLTLGRANAEKDPEGMEFFDADQNLANDIDSLFPSGIQNMDFTQFWESFKPLVQHEGLSPSIPNQSFDFNLDDLEEAKDVPFPNLEDIDPAKLAEDVQALFSGCLV